MTYRGIVRGLIALLCVAVAVSLTSLRPSVAFADTSSRVVLNQPCTYDPADDGAYAVPAPGIQCVAGLAVHTRGGIDPSCIASPTATVPGTVYYIGQCKGVTTNQAEAIAQARAIAKMNAGAFRDSQFPPGTINPDIQWETYLPHGWNTAPTGRADLVLYDRTTADSPLGIVEIKGDWNGGEVVAEQQVSGYVQNNATAFGQHPVQAYNFGPGGFSDTFSINACAQSTGA